MSNVVRTRVCRQCGREFKGGPRAWYCPECRAARQKEAAARYRKNGAERHLGTISQCTICGKEYIVESGLQRYCTECAAKHLKQVDNAASLQYKKANPDKAKKSNSDFLKRNNGSFRKTMWQNCIAELRGKASLTQSQVAKKMGTTQTHISQWELGKRKPDSENYRKLCALFCTDSLEDKND